MTGRATRVEAIVGCLVHCLNRILNNKLKREIEEREEMNYYQDSGDLIIKLYAKDDYTVKYQVCKNTKITSSDDTVSKKVISPTGRTKRFAISFSHHTDALSYSAESMLLTERINKSGPIRTKSSYDLTNKIEALTELIKEAGGIVLTKDDKYFNRLDPKKTVVKVAEKKVIANKMSKGDFLKEIGNFT